MKNNISLIGMPAAGKSTVGVILAKYMNMGFIDTDILIQTVKKKKLFEIIEESGLEKFCEIEGRIVSSIDTDSTVIATGGSVIYNDDAMKNLKENGKIIYLKTSYEAVAKRLQNLEERGVVHKNDQSVYDLYLERVPLYEKWSELTIDTSFGKPEDVVAEIMNKIGSI